MSQYLNTKQCLIISLEEKRHFVCIHADETRQQYEKVIVYVRWISVDLFLTGSRVRSIFAETWPGFSAGSSSNF